jgi:periplasmic divalent cation tolerance protein
MKIVAFWISCPNKTNAKKITSELVKRKLIFFGQIFPVESLYWWDGKVFPDKQSVIFAEGNQKDLLEIERAIRKFHQDKVPCWSVLEVSKISAASRNWIKRNYSK